MYFLSRKLGFILSYKTETGAPSDLSCSLLLSVPFEAHACHWLCRSMKHEHRGDTAFNWLDDLRSPRKVSAYCGNLSLRHLGLSAMPLEKGALDWVLDAAGMSKDSSHV